MEQNSLKNRLKLPLSIDCVVFGPRDGSNFVLLIQRKKEPFRGRWALPGGFLEEGERLRDCALRELKEETGLSDVYLKQFHTFSEPERDPRGRVITSAYYAVVRPSDHALKATADAQDAKWFALDKLPPLAFDHEIILRKGIACMRRDLISSAIVFDILPCSFSLGQLQKLMECLLEQELDKRNFRKKILAFPFIEETGEIEEGKKQRPAKLYRFRAELFCKIKQEDLRLTLV